MIKSLLRTAFQKVYKVSHNSTTHKSELFLESRGFSPRGIKNLAILATASFICMFTSISSWSAACHLKYVLNVSWGHIRMYFRFCEGCANMLVLACRLLFVNTPFKGGVRNSGEGQVSCWAWSPGSEKNNILVWRAINTTVCSSIPNSKIMRKWDRQGAGSL